MFRHHTLKSFLLLLLVIVTGGALFGWAVGRVAGVAANVGGSGATSLSLPNPPAVTQDALMSDTALWPVADGSVGGVTYSFQYPSTWTAGLLYCSPGAGNNLKQRGAYLPTGCASTDILVGPKARDVGLSLSGSRLTIGGKSARRLIEANPANDLVSQLYTVMVYDGGGAPFFGFTTQIGPATDKATLDAITATLDAMAATIKVEARP